MKNSISYLLLFLLIGSSFWQCTVKPSSSHPIGHNSFDNILKKYVDDNGFVDYQGLSKNLGELKAYTALLSQHHPNEQHWSEKERLAYWINAYNAFTLQLVAENYPTNSIKSIKKGIPFVNSVWDIKFINIQGIEYDLNNIEHSILRKEFEEPRIHFAINCASFSCPVLLNEAYTSEKLEDQLHQQAVRFFNDPTRNEISANYLKISKILTWFGSDFKKEGNLIEYIQPYTEITIHPDAAIDFKDYDWNLNEQK